MYFLLTVALPEILLPFTDVCLSCKRYIHVYVLFRGFSETLSTRFYFSTNNLTYNAEPNLKSKQPQNTQHASLQSFRKAELLDEKKRSLLLFRQKRPTKAAALYSGRSAALQGLKKKKSASICIYISCEITLLISHGNARARKARRCLDKARVPY